MATAAWFAIQTASSCEVGESYQTVHDKSIVSIAQTKSLLGGWGVVPNKAHHTALATVQR